MERITKICAEKKFKFIGFVDEWKHSKTKFIVKCDHDHEWVTNINSFTGKQDKCPKCSVGGFSTKKPSVLYIQKLSQNNILKGIKFGITNRTAQVRLKQQSKESKFYHEIFYELTLQDGQKILDLENKIKEAMKGKTSYISKEDMPDGFTETVAPSELSTIMYIVKSFEKELTA